MPGNEPVAIAFIGLGSNLADPLVQVRQALMDLESIPGTRVTARSSLYRTPPVGYLEQPDFINAVASVHTTLKPQALLAALLTIEDRHGRPGLFCSAKPCRRPIWRSTPGPRACRFRFMSPEPTRGST